jgi:hypothetical protein
LGCTTTPTPPVDPPSDNGGNNGPSNSNDNEPWEIDGTVTIDLHIGPTQNAYVPEYYGDYEDNHNIPYIPGISPRYMSANPCIGAGGKAAGVCFLSLFAAIATPIGPVNTNSNFFLTFNVNYNEQVGITMSEMQYSNLASQAMLRTVKINGNVIHDDTPYYMPTDGTYRPISGTGGVYNGNNRLSIDVAVYSVFSTPNGSGGVWHLGEVNLPSLPEIRNFVQTMASMP